MANALFAFGKETLLSTTNYNGFDSDSIKDVLVDHGTDTPAPATDTHLDDILAGARVATSGAYTSKTITGGVFDAADVTHSAVSGASVESIVIFDDTPGTEATKPLFVFIDTATGLPVTPNGGDIIIQWDSGANKIFAL